MKKLHRSPTCKWLAGVFGGFGEIWNIDPMVIRLAAIFVCLTTGVLPLLITYFIAWLVVPKGSPIQA
jgi:phage shock protein C